MDFIELSIFKNMSYLWMIVFIMISAGLAKEFELFSSTFAYIRNTFKSNKFVMVILSAIGGVLPIEGRVTVSAGLLDSLTHKHTDDTACNHGREKMGIVDYLSTHHYYLWSPLEKTVILPIAAFGLTYAAWMYMIAPILIVSLIFIGWYIWTQVHGDDIYIPDAEFKISSVIRNVLPMLVAITAYAKGIDHVWAFGILTLYYMLITQQWYYKKLLKYIKWDVITIVGVVIILANYMKSHSGMFEAMLKGSAVDPSTLVGITILSSVGFVASFLMGSSGKFVALAVIMAQLFGIEYFLWFFTVEFVAYLISPMHKCVAVGNRYFNTPLRTYYTALGTWSVLLLITAGAITFI